MTEQDKGGGNDQWLDRVYHSSDRDALAKTYDEWAADYDAHLQGFGYRNTALTVGLVCRHVAADAGEVLDAACGTGLIGEDLHTLGYDGLVGIDLSEGMIETSRARGVYTELSRMMLGERLGFADGRFAATIAIGVLTIGHAPPSSLDELLRVTKRGGLLIFSLPQPAYEEGGFKEKMAELDAAGAWQHVESTRPYRVLPGAANEGEMLSHIHVYRVG
ncbi:class I SAM-dependent DNA methyltransferase [Lutibaculum baratangense]|uniref:Weak similarity to ubiquinone/menaquinone biosynthesis methyl transferase n=1 Tax=Lutibaculum baratangense AMV1 TaxID=631454 RepID=V4QZT5_9HYPH|nr:class I SAM-dependent methyltransferase [Lutibaculum baratangense]ESR25277.1 weak similarity to ubiquinone/menaquinone biosynthesis methyl transferase [Lutibaculum baratangense AMV1]